MKCKISKAHVRIYLAVEGAVRNTQHGHPNWKITRDMARSIAKRATGTLTAGWPDVLAARSTPSDPADDPGLGGHWPPRRCAIVVRKGVRHATVAHPTLRRLRGKLGAMAKEARHAGRKERLETLVEILRLL